MDGAVGRVWRYPVGLLTFPDVRGVAGVQEYLGPRGVANHTGVFLAHRRLERW